jgi:putative ABC transport system permease protein
VGNVLQDFRSGLRMLAKDPGVTAVAVVALALGIGGNTVIFSSVEGVLLRPFALQDSDRTVAVWETVPQQNQQISA